MIRVTGDPAGVLHLQQLDRPLHVGKTAAAQLGVRRRIGWSPWGSRAHFLWRQGLPRPELQFEGYDENGCLIAVLDFVWHRERVFGEFDGKVKYGRLLRSLLGRAA